MSRSCNCNQSIESRSWKECFWFWPYSAKCTFARFGVSVSVPHLQTFSGVCPQPLLLVPTLVACPPLNSSSSSEQLMHDFTSRGLFSVQYLVPRSLLDLVDVICSAKRVLEHGCGVGRGLMEAISLNPALEEARCINKRFYSDKYMCFLKLMEIQMIQWLLIQFLNCTMWPSIVL